MNKYNKNQDLEINLGEYELFFKQRYTILSYTNDILLGLWFLIGSVFFFWESTKTAGVWLFVLGSIQLIIRPIIRIVHRIHLKRYNKSLNKE